MTVKQKLLAFVDALPDDDNWAEVVEGLLTLRGDLTPKQQALEEQGFLRRPVISDPDERRRVLGEVVEAMNANPIPETAPRRFSRDELHERR